MSERTLNTEILPSKTEKILVALSGGADSVCLTLLLLEAGYSIEAAHFDHMLRGAESERDAVFSRELCESRGVKFHLGFGDVRAYADKMSVGLELAARELRYAFLEDTADETGAVCIATAHNADDNAETMLLNLARGAGLNGLGAIAPSRGRVVRPILGMTRAEILSCLESFGASYVEDSTNALDICARNKLRNAVMPVMREINPRFSEHANKTAALLREDERFLHSLAEEFTDRHYADGALSAEELKNAPRPVALRALRLICHGKALGTNHLEAVLGLCASNEGSRRLDLPGLSVLREYDKLCFPSEKREGFKPFILAPGREAVIREAGLRLKCGILAACEQIHSSLNIFCFKSDSICGNITVRPRLEGDRIRLSGREGTRTLKKMFIDSKIPARKRSLVPVFADERGVIAVYGFGVSERCGVRPGDRAIIIEMWEDDSFEQ